MQHSLNQPRLRPNKPMGQDNFLNTAKIHRLLNTPRGIRGNALEYVGVNTENQPHPKSNKSGDDAKQSGSHRSRSLRRYNPGQVPRVYSQFRFIRTPLANSLKVYHNGSTTGIKKLRGPSDPEQNHTETCVCCSIPSTRIYAALPTAPLWYKLHPQRGAAHSGNICLDIQGSRHGC